jgi:hypothetical protein
MESKLVVYYKFGHKTPGTYSYNVPAGCDLNKLLAEARKDHPRAYKYYLRLYVDPYQDWDMNNERLCIRRCKACTNGLYIS